MIKFFIGCIAVLFLMACTYKAYDEGNGDYSFLQTETVTLKPKVPFLVDEATLDNGTTLAFAKSVKRAWAGRTDSVYRAIMSFTPNGNSINVEQLEQMFLLVPLQRGNNQIESDAVGIKSVWLAKNKEFIDLRLAIKDGLRESKDQAHSIYIVETKSTIYNDGSKKLEWQLVHKQNNIPEVITSTFFATIYLKNINKGDTIIFKAKDYKGEKTFSFVR